MFVNLIVGAVVSIPESVTSKICWGLVVPIPTLLLDIVIASTALLLPNNNGPWSSVIPALACIFPSEYIPLELFT